MRTKRTVHAALLFFTLAIAVCYGSIFAYARMGGAWAASQVIPSPPQSSILAEYAFEENAYQNLVTMYLISDELVDVRNWFSKYIPMTPVDNRLTKDDIAYYSVGGTPPSIGNTYLLLLSASILTSPNSYTKYEFLPLCFGVEVYKPEEFLTTEYYAKYLLNRNTSFENHIVGIVKRCWPDIS